MGESKGVVKFHMVEQFTLPGRKNLKEAIIGLMSHEGVGFTSLDYIFCSDEYLLEINQKYLQHDDLTDIITFNLSEQEGEIIGEIYISIERVRDNALLFGADFEQELKRVIFHGALHLCGYGDKTKREQLEMRKKEDFYLSR